MSLTIDIINQIKSIHFVGIGGSSMSGLAQFMLKQGKKVYGSDRQDSTIIKELEKAGCTVQVPHSESIITQYKPDLVVYTVAVPLDNPELTAAKSLGLLVVDRSEFLGALINTYPTSIAIAGTHGKTTATSMVASIFYMNHLDPAIHIGGVLPLIGSNTHVGAGEHFILEACEYHRSFLQFHANIALILNVELDHVDYFKDFDDFKQAFKDFCSNVSPSGAIIVNGDDADAVEVANASNAKIITYGIGADHDWSAKDIIYDKTGCAAYTLYQKGQSICKVELGTTGFHNVLNSLGAIGCAVSAGISVEDCLKPLKEFHGAGRRFEHKGRVNGILVVDDYAHHPTEITATLAAAKNASGSGNVWCVFQPHTYTRTKNLIGLFSESFHDAYKVIVTDIYAAREKDPGGIDSIMLTDKIQAVSHNAIYCNSFTCAVDYVCANARPNDIIITMGAGNITNVGEMILKKLL